MLFNCRVLMPGWWISPAIPVEADSPKETLEQVWNATQQDFTTLKQPRSTMIGDLFLVFDQSDMDLLGVYRVMALGFKEVDLVDALMYCGVPWHAATLESTLSDKDACTIAEEEALKSQQQGYQWLPNLLRNQSL